MRPIEGIHHITLITGDGPRNVDFYARVLGLRMVKKTVNQDEPNVYHLFYSDEQGSAGADITFFVYPGLQPGRAGAGMVERIAHRVASEEAFDFWSQRFENEGVEFKREAGALRFWDPEGMNHELVVEDTTDAPLLALSNQVPAEHALQGFSAVHAVVADIDSSEALVRDGLGFEHQGDHTWQARGAHRGSRITFEHDPRRGVGAAGTVHHIAWAVYDAEQERWRERVTRFGASPTPIIDRFYFHSVYFREPSGILYELATIDGAGFVADEPRETMGQSLSLPPAFQSRRAQIEHALTPLPDTSAWRP